MKFHFFCFHTPCDRSIEIGLGKVVISLLSIDFNFCGMSIFNMFGHNNNSILGEAITIEAIDENDSNRMKLNWKWFNFNDREYNQREIILLFLLLLID